MLPEEPDLSRVKPGVLIAAMVTIMIILVAVILSL